MAPAWECEPNDLHSQASGPLLSGEDYFGYPKGEKNDWFEIHLDTRGDISVTLDDHTGKGVQLLLYDSGYVPGDTSRCFDNDGPNGSGTYVMTCPDRPAGDYFIRIYTEALDNHNLDTPYILRAIFPQNPSQQRYYHRHTGQTDTTTGKRK
jgi:hypothetical protein